MLTTNNYKESNTKVYFGCEKTTVAYILSAINRRFSYGNGLNPYAIERSNSFFVSTLKKPSQAIEQDISKFKQLRRDNLAKSLGRFHDYKEQTHKIEYKHLQAIEPLIQ